MRVVKYSDTSLVLCEVRALGIGCRIIYAAVPCTDTVLSFSYSPIREQNDIKNRNTERKKARYYVL